MTDPVLELLAKALDHEFEISGESSTPPTRRIVGAIYAAMPDGMAHPVWGPGGYMHDTQTLSIRFDPRFDEYVAFAVSYWRDKLAKQAEDHGTGDDSVDSLPLSGSVEQQGDDIALGSSRKTSKINKLNAKASRSKVDAQGHSG